MVFHATLATRNLIPYSRRIWVEITFSGGLKEDAPPAGREPRTTEVVVKYATDHATQEVICYRSDCCNYNKMSPECVPPVYNKTTIFTAFGELRDDYLKRGDILILCTLPATGIQLDYVAHNMLQQFPHYRRVASFDARLNHRSVCHNWSPTEYELGTSFSTPPEAADHPVIITLVNRYSNMRPSAVGGGGGDNNVYNRSITSSCINEHHIKQLLDTSHERLQFFKRALLNFDSKFVCWQDRFPLTNVKTVVIPYLLGNCNVEEWMSEYFPELLATATRLSSDLMGKVNFVFLIPRIIFNIDYSTPNIRKYTEVREKFLKFPIYNFYQNSSSSSSTREAATTANPSSSSSSSTREAAAVATTTTTTTTPSSSSSIREAVAATEAITAIANPSSFSSSTREAAAATTTANPSSSSSIRQAVAAAEAIAVIGNPSSSSSSSSSTREAETTTTTAAAAKLSSPILAAALANPSSSTRKAAAAATTVNPSSSSTREATIKRGRKDEEEDQQQQQQQSPPCKKMTLNANPTKNLLHKTIDQIESAKAVVAAPTTTTTITHPFETIFIKQEWEEEKKEAEETTTTTTTTLVETHKQQDVMDKEPPIKQEECRAAMDD